MRSAVEFRGESRNFWLAGGFVPAHRAALILSGVEVPEDCHVCHRCDVPLCVRPDHLFVGSREENMRDMAAKGRSAQGERHGQSRLTSAQVLALRQLRAEGWLLKDLSAAIGVSREAVGNAVSGRTWSHLPEVAR